LRTLAHSGPASKVVAALYLFHHCVALMSLVQLVDFVLRNVIFRVRVCVIIRFMPVIRGSAIVTANACVILMIVAVDC